MADQFSNVDELSSPARRMFVITPHASNEVDPLPKAIRADSAGDVVLRAVGSSSDVTITMAAGEVLAVRAQFVRATGTTVAAGDLHGLG
jgi:hypothetical protein